MSDTDFTAADSFFKRVRRANKSGSKDIKLTMEEAVDLATIFGILTSKVSELSIALDQGGRTSSAPTIDGGSFK